MKIEGRQKVCLGMSIILYLHLKSQYKLGKKTIARSTNVRFFTGLLALPRHLWTLWIIASHAFTPVLCAICACLQAEIIQLTFLGGILLFLKLGSGLNICYCTSVCLPFFKTVTFSVSQSFCIPLRVARNLEPTQPLTGTRRGTPWTRRQSIYQFPVILWTVGANQSTLR